MGGRVLREVRRHTKPQRAAAEKGTPRARIGQGETRRGRLAQHTKNMTPETAVEMVRLIMARGKTALEAFREFSDAEMGAAVNAELDAKQGPGFGPLFELACEAGAEERDEKDMEQAVELWLAGWTSEKPSASCAVMSWYWRSPPKGKRPRGKLHLSTNQAYRAMRRSLGLPILLFR